MNDITLQQIEVFLTVSEQLNLSEAARNLFINQSAVSRWIQRMETNLNTTLFVRTNRGVELTENGEFLYTELKPIYEKLSETILNMHKVYAMKEDILRLGCMDSSEVINALQVAVREFERVCPDTLIKIELYSFKDLREALVCGKIDCIVSYMLGFGEYLNIQEKKIKKLDTYIAVSANSPLAGSVDIPVKQLENEKLFLLYTAEMTDAETRAIETCKKIGFMPGEIIYMPSYFSLELAVKNGRGFSISGTNMCDHFGSDIKLYHVVKPYREQYVIMAWRKNGCSPLTKNFLESIKGV